MRRLLVSGSLRMPAVNCTYCKYFLVGAVVGVATILGREIIAGLLPADTPGYYLGSIVLTYTGAIVASFLGHYHVTFSHISNKQVKLASITRFSIIAILGLCLTAMLSFLLRYFVNLEMTLGKYLPSIAFGAATVLASLVTYKLNARYVFVDSEPESMASDNNQRNP